MESAASFGPLRPTNFVNFAERREARPIFGGVGQPFFCGASQPFRHREADLDQILLI